MIVRNKARLVLLQLQERKNYISYRFTDLTKLYVYLLGDPALSGAFL